MKNNYAIKWVLQRITAIFLIPLSIWFIYNCILFQNLNYLEIQFFFKSYLNCSLFILMITLTVIHSKLGLETIIQDYFPEANKRKIFKTIINIISAMLIILTIISLYKINLS